MSEFGSIIFSPPYEAALSASKHVGGITARDPQLAKVVKNMDEACALVKVGFGYVTEYQGGKIFRKR